MSKRLALALALPAASAFSLSAPSPALGRRQALGVAPIAPARAATTAGGGRPCLRTAVRASPADKVTGAKFEEPDEKKNPQQRPGHSVGGSEIDTPVDDVLRLDEALRRLEQDEPEIAEVVMLRYFSGLTVEETAEVLSVSAPTVKRRWRYAKAWLRGRMTEDDGDEGDSTDA